MPEKHFLRQMQALPLRAKVLMSQQRIREWYDHFDGEVCVSFSGGKDSTVLATLVHEWYPDVPLVFANTGLEYPEIQAFAKKMGAEFVRPKMRFDEVISKYGYPIISKENAEAIYYARRIRNSEGGGYETERRRTDVLGTRQDWESQRQRKKEQTSLPGYKRAQFTWGGVPLNTNEQRSASAMESTAPEYSWGGGITEKHAHTDESAGDGRTSQTVCQTHEIVMGGVQTGLTGGDEPLPG